MRWLLLFKSWTEKKYFAKIEKTDRKGEIV